MEIVSVAPKDLHFLLDITLKDAVKLSTILDNMVFNMEDESDLMFIEANEYLHNVFYPKVNEMLEIGKDGS